MKVIALRVELNFIFLLMISILTFCTVSKAIGAELEVSDRTAALDDTVTFDVSLNTAPNDVDAMGLDIRYDPSVLSFNGYLPGSLTAGFDFLNANNVSPGTVRIGGFAVGHNKILEGESGSVVTLMFNVIGPGDCLLGIAQLKDDVRGWTARNGEFAGLSTAEEMTTNPLTPEEEATFYSQAAQKNDSPTSTLGWNPITDAGRTSSSASDSTAITPSAQPSDPEISSASTHRYPGMSKNQDQSTTYGSGRYDDPYVRASARHSSGELNQTYSRRFENTQTQQNSFQRHDRLTRTGEEKTPPQKGPISGQRTVEPKDNGIRTSYFAKSDGVHRPQERGEGKPEAYSQPSVTQDTESGPSVLLITTAILLTTFIGLEIGSLILWKGPIFWKMAKRTQS